MRGEAVSSHQTDLPLSVTRTPQWSASATSRENDQGGQGPDARLRRLLAAPSKTSAASPASSLTLSTAAKWGIDKLYGLCQLFASGPWIPPAIEPRKLYVKSTGNKITPGGVNAW